MIPFDLRFSNAIEILCKRKHKKSLSEFLVFPTVEMKKTLAEETSLYSALSERKLIFPENYSSLKYFAWWISLNILIPDNDYFKADYLRKILETAINRWTENNEYSFWVDFLFWFFSEEETETDIPLESVFSIPDLLEFAQSKLSQDDIFGNLAYLVMENLKQSTQRFKLKKIKLRKPINPQRKRGYHDKGSRRDSHISTIGKIVTADKKQLWILKQAYRNRIRILEQIEKGNWSSYPYN